jgi:hypothetical protein
MTGPQWVPPGSGPAPDSAAGPHGEHPAYPPAPSVPAPGAPLAAGQGYPPPGQWAPPALEFRPGIIPLRPLNLGDLYGAVIKAIRGNVAATMGLAFLTTLVFLVPTTALGVWIASLETADFESEEVPVAGTVSAYVPALGTSVSSILLTGFLAFVIGQAVMGRRVSAGQTWEGTRSRILALVGATIVTGLILVVAMAAVVVIPVVVLVGAANSGGDSGIAGAVILLILSILAAIALTLFLATRLAFVAAAIVLERVGVGGGIRRSWQLTGQRQFWRILGIRILTAIIVGIAAQILSLPLAMIGILGALGTGDPSQMFVWQAVVAGVSGLITGALTTPFTAGVDALLYVDQRIRREGFDVQLIIAAQADAAQYRPGAAPRR